MIATIAAARMSTHPRSVALVGHVGRNTPGDDVSLGYQIKQVGETRTTWLAQIHLDNFGQRITRSVVVAPERQERLG